MQFRLYSLRTEKAVQPKVKWVLSKNPDFKAHANFTRHINIEKHYYFEWQAKAVTSNILDYQIRP